MKIVFSRKGFDSSAGGYPSPIFPNGEIFSIPIPSQKDREKFRDLNYTYQKDSIQKILKDLTSVKPSEKIHNDPKVCEDYYVLGQANQAQSHLKTQGITTGDIFLFYGWFKEVEKVGKKWQYKKDAKELHLIHSYMEVENVLEIKAKNSSLEEVENNKKEALKKYPFLNNHSHLFYNDVINGIYLSTTFKHFDYDEKRVLTDLKNYVGRSTWRLPKCFNYPESFTYLNNFFPSSDNDFVNVNYKGFGQEFVLDIDTIKVCESQEQINKYCEEIIRE